MKKNTSYTQWIYLFIFVCILTMVMPGKRGLLNHIRLRQKAYHLRQEIKQLEAQKARLEEEIKNLNDAAEIEKIAREKYGMARKDEKVYRVVPKEQN